MRSSALKLAMMLTTALSIFLVIVGFLIYKNALISLGAWSYANKIQVFLKADATENEILELQNKIQKIESVQDVKLVDRQSAGQQFKSSLKEFSSGLITEDELIDLIPITLEIDLDHDSNPEQRQKQIDYVVSQIDSSSKLVEEIYYSKTWFEKFKKIDRYIRALGTIAFLIILILTSFMISLMTRVYIEDSKSDIEVYNLVGATKWTIYKVFFADLLKFLVFGLCVSFASSYLFFELFKSHILRKNLLPLFAEHFRFLSAYEASVLFLSLVVVFLLHAFYTVSSSINSLNQMQND